MITRISFIIASIILLSFLIKLCMFQSTVMEKFITGMIISLIFSTFVIMSFLAKKAIPYALVVFMVIMIIFNAISINIPDETDVLESMTIGTKLGQDQTTIGPYRKNTSRDYKVKTNSTILNWGIDPITKANAIESFANIEHYENSDISKLQAEADTISQNCTNKLDDLNNQILVASDDAGYVPKQGICYTEDGEPGQYLLSGSNDCVPLNQEEEVQCETDYNLMDFSSQEMEEEKTSSSNCIPSAASMGCYDCSTDFDTLCGEINGSNYIMDSVEKCDSPYQNKCKATCKAISCGGFLTPCYDKGVDLNTICKSLADQSNFNNFQRMGVAEFRSCPRRDQQKALCKLYHHDTFLTHPQNATACILPENASSLPGLCREKNSKFIPFDLGSYDCPMGLVRANCATQDEINKMKSAAYFNKDIYA